MGAGWGAYVMGKPELNRRVGAAIGAMVGDGYVRPPVGGRFPLEQAAEALKMIDERRATGKVVLDVRAPVVADLGGPPARARPDAWPGGRC